MPHCPVCNSPQPHLHPAVQVEGEVETCADAFHMRPTPQNKPEYIAAVVRKRYDLKIAQHRPQPGTQD